MKHIYAFEKLLAWQTPREITRLIYKKTNSFPKEELFGITSQTIKPFLQTIKHSNPCYSTTTAGPSTTSALR